MPANEIKLGAASVASLRIIAAGIIFAFLYFASSVIMTLVLAVLFAYFLDPVVEFLERRRVPRAPASLLILLAVMFLVGATGYLLVHRANQFAANWPRYSAVLHNAATAVDRKLSTVETQVEAISPEENSENSPVRVSESRSIKDWLLVGVGSLYSTLLVGAFLPFLVFFMLAAKPQIWHATMELFPVENRVQVKEALDQLSIILRSYLAGHALVTGILILASAVFFRIIHLDYPLLTGCVSGLLNLVPYLGVVLAWLPPFFIGMTKWNTLAPYLAVAVTLVAFHLVGVNVLMPAIVGRRVHLNPLAVTISLLLWGWMWGAIGLLLAIPITATIKVICDHIDGWEPAGRWLGAP